MEAAYHVNQIIWAKINGYPWWPAYVNSASDADKYEVVFFGDFSRAILNSSKLKEFEGIAHKIDGKNKTLDAAVRSVERVLAGEATIMEEWAKCNKAPSPKRKLSKRKSIKKADKGALENADELSLCLSQRSKTKYANFLSKMEADAKLELKRYASCNNKLTSSTYNHVLETQLFADDIACVEEQLEGLWMALRGDDFEPDACLASLTELQAKIKACDVRSVFASSIGSLLTSCTNVCRLKASEAGHKRVLDALKAIVREVCEFVIRDGFLMESKVSADYIDCSKRNSILNVFALDVYPSTPADNNNNKLAMDKRLTVDEECAHAADEEETRSPHDALDVDERVQFRVKKKLAKVMYGSAGKTKHNKKVWEELATRVEALVRKSSKALPQYKEKVVCLVKNLENSSAAVCGLMGKGKGANSLEEEVNLLSSN